MSLESLKLSIAGVWIVATAAVGVALHPSSAASGLALAAFGLLPPLWMMFAWTAPPQTMSEIIRGGRNRH